MATKAKKAHSAHGSHTTSMTKKVLGLLVVVCVLVGAFVFIPKNPGNLSSQYVGITVPTSTNDCPDATPLLKWNPNPESNVLGYKLYISGPNGETMIDIVGRYTNQYRATLAAAPDPGITYTLYLTAYNSTHESDRASITYTAICEDDGEVIIAPPTNPPYPKPTYNTCDYTAKQCKTVDGTSDSTCTLGNNAPCLCQPPKIMGNKTVYSVELSTDGMASWMTYMMPDVGANFDINAERDRLAFPPDGNPNVLPNNPPLHPSAFLRIKSEVIQDCINPPSNSGSSFFGGNTVSSGPSLWSRLMTYISSLFSSKSLTSNTLSTTAPSQPGSYKDVEVTIKNLGEGNHVVMSGDLGSLTIKNASPFKAAFPKGTKLSFTAVTGPNSTFTGWTGACTTIVGNTCSFTVKEQATNITAAFDYKKVTLTANMSPTATGLGVVTSSYKDIECGAGKLKCTKEYAYNTFEFLTAVPSVGSVFTGWSGACTGTGKCAFLVNSNKTVTATFAAIINGVCSTTTNACTAGTFIDTVDTATQYTWNCAGINGGATSSCTKSKPLTNGVCGTTTNTCTAGTFVDITDTTTAYKWNCTGINGGSTSSCSANKPTTYTLKAVKVGPGTILRGTSSFSGGVFPLGTTITLTARPATGAKFYSWAGCTSVSGSTCTVYINANKTVTATFKY